MNILTPILTVLLTSFLLVAILFVLGRTLKFVRFIFDGVVRIIKGEDYYPETPFGFKGKLVYTDSSRNSKLFRSSKYKVQAKPDFIYETAYQKHTLIEYKERNGKVYLSDEVQMLASVLAARSRYNVTHAYVVTGKERKGGKLADSATIYKQIKPYIIETRQINRCGKTNKATPNKYKCPTCAMRQSCAYRSCI